MTRRKHKRDDRPPSKIGPWVGRVRLSDEPLVFDPGRAHELLGKVVITGDQRKWQVVSLSAVSRHMASLREISQRKDGQRAVQGEMWKVPVSVVWDALDWGLVEEQ